LRDGESTHAGLVVEDPPEVLAVGEDLVLQGKEGTAGVHEVEAGQPVLGGDLLGAEVLLHGQGKVGSPLHGRVVGDDHHLAATHATDPRDHAGRGRGPVIDAVGGEGPDLQERGVGVEQLLDTVAHEELPLLAVAAHRLLPAALSDRREPRPQLRNQALHVQAVVAEIGVRRVDVALEDGHRRRVCHGPRPAPRSTLILECGSYC
jgi:hypothetical protein